MQHLTTDASKSPKAFFARNEASEDGYNTGHFTTFYFPEQPMLVNVLDDLGSNDVGAFDKAWSRTRKRQGVMA